jgi:hypothetical protein
MDDGSGVAETPLCRREYIDSESVVAETNSVDSADTGTSTDNPSETASGIVAASSTSGSGAETFSLDFADAVGRLRSATMTPLVLLSVKIHSSRQALRVISPHLRKEFFATLFCTRLASKQ